MVADSFCCLCVREIGNGDDLAPFFSINFVRLEKLFRCVAEKSYVEAFTIMACENIPQQLHGGVHVPEIRRQVANPNFRGMPFMVHIATKLRPFRREWLGACTGNLV